MKRAEPARTGGSDPQCKWCGLPASQHEVEGVHDGYAYVSKLVGVNGHLFEAVVFPLRGVPPASRTADRAAVLRAQGGEFALFNELKTADLKALSVEQLVGLAAYGGTYREASEALQVPCSWIDGRLKDIHSTIALKREDDLRARLRAIEEEEQKLKTNAERRVDLADERANLERLLASNRPRSTTGV